MVNRMIAAITPTMVENTPENKPAMEVVIRVVAPKKSKYKPKANKIDMTKKAKENIRLQISSSLMAKLSRLIPAGLVLARFSPENRPPRGRGRGKFICWRGIIAGSENGAETASVVHLVFILNHCFK